MLKYDYLIVGAGLFGAVFAHEASLRGKRCLVIDKRPHIGGNIYTERMDGIHVHRYGAHIFHTDDREVWEYINGFGEFNRFTNSPLANYKGELYNLPFNMNTFYKLWGVADPEEAGAVIASQRLCIADPRNLEEQALSLVGRDIYEKLIKGYTEKQWGRDCKDLPSFIIKRLPLRFTWDNSYFNDRYQGIPIEGYTPIIERMLAGSDVRLGIDYLTDRDRLSAMADKTVYTGMPDAFYSFRFGRLEYRSLRFETETLAKPNYQGNAVVNYTDRDVPWTRIIEHRHFSCGSGEVSVGGAGNLGGNAGGAGSACDPNSGAGSCASQKTVITREYPHNFGIGYEPYYPINDERNNTLAAQYRESASHEKGVIFGGRLGDYAYYDMWQVVRKALDAARRELRAHNFV